MAKTKRGKVLKKIPNWRGTCPLCARTRVKLLWTGKGEHSKLKICKRCGV